MLVGPHRTKAVCPQAPDGNGGRGYRWLIKPTVFYVFFCPLISRERALAWKLSESSLVEAILVAPGNYGTGRIHKSVNINWQFDANRETQPGGRLVVKASGLISGQGLWVSKTKKEATTILSASSKSRSLAPLVFAVP